jgi:hypothetical protein
VSRWDIAILVFWIGGCAWSLQKDLAKIEKRLIDVQEALRQMKKL